ncbi:MAG: exodeoxyribonuclease VII large subunit [Betaproteobacteria bacterium HGW-Betaproteobacteria-11]|nr:MAG: exodeoxyribonuclease VII large subunit [Betaproteobacteria bacterium HGW-Betaproteobacteria-11]
MIESTTVIAVGELTRLARQTLESTFPLLWVAGEVSNLTRAVSGHLYFTLKDETAQVRCVMFRLRAQSIPWRLENGQQVEARVLVSLYEPRGDFQLNVETMRRAGLGRLFEAFAHLKSKLELEGLFAPERKQPLPRFPRRIGIVCSPRAAALHDVLTALRRRAPHLDVLLYPALVQGEAAAGEIATAITLANQRNECDLLLVVRGGGSLEDLWAFNEEVVARALARSFLPIISGVGHETDTTITDLVADVRAATPTAAAELASQAWYETRQTLADMLALLHTTTRRRIERERQRIDHLGLRLIHPAVRLRQGRDRLPLLGARLDAATQRVLRRRQERVDALALRLSRAAPRTTALYGRLELLAQRLETTISRGIQRRRHGLEQLADALTHLDPQQVLARGFAIVRGSEGKIIRTATDLSPEEAIDIQFAVGTAQAMIIDTTHGRGDPAVTVVSRDNPD